MSEITEIEGRFVENLRRLAAGLREGESIAFFPERDLQKLAHGFFVVDDEDSAQSSVLRSSGKCTEITVPFEAMLST